MKEQLKNKIEELIKIGLNSSVNSLSTIREDLNSDKSLFEGLDIHGLFNDLYLAVYRINYPRRQLIDTEKYNSLINEITENLIIGYKDSVKEMDILEERFGLLLGAILDNTVTIQEAVDTLTEIIFERYSIQESSVTVGD